MLDPNLKNPSTKKTNLKQIPMTQIQKFEANNPSTALPN
jgi:hypothetical protein